MNQGKHQHQRSLAQSSSISNDKPVQAATPPSSQRAGSAVIHQHPISKPPAQADVMSAHVGPKGGIDTVAIGLPLDCPSSTPPSLTSHLPSSSMAGAITTTTVTANSASPVGRPRHIHKSQEEQDRWRAVGGSGRSTGHAGARQEPPGFFFGGDGQENTISTAARQCITALPPGDASQASGMYSFQNAPMFQFVGGRSHGQRSFSFSAGHHHPSASTRQPATLSSDNNWMLRRRFSAQNSQPSHQDAQHRGEPSLPATAEEFSSATTESQPVPRSRSKSSSNILPHAEELFHVDEDTFDVHQQGMPNIWNYGDNGGRRFGGQRRTDHTRHFIPTIQRSATTGRTSSFLRCDIGCLAP